MDQRRRSTARSSGSLIVRRRNSDASVRPHRPSHLKRAARTSNRLRVWGVRPGMSKSTMKREPGQRDGREPDALRRLRWLGAGAAFLAVLGITLLVLWFVL